MGDHNKPSRTMQVTVFQPGNSSNSPHSLPPLLHPQATFPNPQPIRPTPQRPQPMIQTHANFQPIVPTPVRFMASNNKFNPQQPAPPIVENLRLVGTAQCQYRQIVSNPGSDAGQRMIPQYTKIVPRMGPTRYATIQPGHPGFTINRQIQPRQYNVNGAPTTSTTVFQAVAFTTPQNNMINKTPIVAKSFTPQLRNEPGDSPPVLQQEEPCRQNVPTPSNEASSTSTVEQRILAQLALTANIPSGPTPEPTVAPQPQIPEIPTVPVKRRRDPIDEDDNLIQYPPQKTEEDKKNFQPPEVYELDKFLTEAVFKPKGGILHHHVNGVDIAEYPEGIDEDRFTGEKYRKVSAMVGLEVPKPKKAKKSPVRKQNKRTSDVKKEPKTENEKERNEQGFAKFFDQVSEKAKSAGTDQPFQSTPIKKPTKVGTSSLQNLTSDAEVAAPETVPTEEPQPGRLDRASRRSMRSSGNIVRENEEENNAKTPETVRNVPTEELSSSSFDRASRRTRDKTNGTTSRNNEKEKDAQSSEKVPTVPTDEPRQTRRDKAVRNLENKVNATTAKENQENNNGAAIPATPPAPVANPPRRSPPPNPTPASPPESELRKIAESCAMEIANCSVNQVPGGLPLKRLSCWTVEECQNWTQQVTNCDDYRGIFEREEIDGSVLVFVPYNELAQLLNLRFGPAKKMEVALKVVKAFDSRVRNM